MRRDAPERREMVETAEGRIAVSHADSWRGATNSKRRGLVEALNKTELEAINGLKQASAQSSSVTQGKRRFLLTASGRAGTPLKKIIKGRVRLTNFLCR